MKHGLSPRFSIKEEYLEFDSETILTVQLHALWTVPHTPRVSSVNCLRWLSEPY